MLGLTRPRCGLARMRSLCLLILMGWELLGMQLTSAQVTAAQMCTAAHVCCRWKVVTGDEAADK